MDTRPLTPLFSIFHFYRLYNTTQNRGHTQSNMKAHIDVAMDLQYCCVFICFFFVLVLSFNEKNIKADINMNYKVFL